jgi:hypothetical protein
MREMRALDALLVHPDIARVEGQLNPVVPAQITTMPPRLQTKAGDREGRLAGMLEHHVDIIALAGDVPDRLAELAASRTIPCIRAC